MQIMNELIKNESKLQSMAEVRCYFGLSKLAVACYQHLWDYGNYLSVAELGARVHCRPSNAYRALHQLEVCGLVKKSKIPEYKSTEYTALPIEEAFDTYRERQRRCLLPIMQAQRRQRPLDMPHEWRE
jgi:predicted transcriptional regulator